MPLQFGSQEAREVQDRDRRMAEARREPWRKQAATERKPLVFGSDEARAVLLRDRELRGVEVLNSFARDEDDRPIRYVAGLWEVFEPLEPEEEAAHFPSKEEFAAIEEGVERAMRATSGTGESKGGS